MNTYNEIAILIVKLVTHVRELYDAGTCYDLEPLFCKLVFLIIYVVVYFSFMTDKIITKDALSKVSRHFYKEVKMNYRNFDYKLKNHMFSLLHFFEANSSQTVRTFFNFNMIILCETIATE